MKFFVRKTRASVTMGILLLLAAAAGLAPDARGENFVSGYDMDGRNLLLGFRYLTGDGELRAFSDLSYQEIGTLYHEIWHAWMLEVDTKKKGDFYRTFKKRAMALHVGAPEDKRVEIHEEAAADFIDAVVTTYLQMRRFLKTKTPERRKEIRETTQYLNVYKRLFLDRYTGYYTKKVRAVQKDGEPERPGPLAGSESIRSAAAEADGDFPTTDTASYKITAMPPDIFRDFVADARKAGLPVKFLEEALKKINSVLFIQLKGPFLSLEADVAWSPHALPRADMALVEKVIFENKLTENPLEVFSEKRF